MSRKITPATYGRSLWHEKPQPASPYKGCWMRTCHDYCQACVQTGKATA